MIRKPSRLTASKLRIILLVVFGLTLGLGVLGFYTLQGVMSNYAKETSSLNSQASASDQNIQSLQRLQTYIEDNKDDITKVNQVVADSQQYQYQNDIVNDLTAFANQSGISIASFTFTQAGSTAPGTAAAPTATTTTPPAAAQPVPSSGLKSTTVSVSLTNPINYTNLLKFISRIEQNLTKMQINSINLTHDQTAGKNEVSSDVFTIEVYVR